MKRFLPWRAKREISTQETAPAIPETSASQETEPRRNRIVVFGTNLGGVQTLRTRLDDFLQERGAPDAQVDAIRYVEGIEDVFSGKNDDGSDVVQPLGVIMLSQMRGYGPTGASMTGDTPVDYIVGLCEQHRVPYVTIERGAPGADPLQDALGRLTLQITQRTKEPGSSPS